MKENTNLNLSILFDLSSHIIFVYTLAKDAQSQWNKLKENYRKCLKRRESATRSGAGAKTLPTCQYFLELSFITDTVTNRSTISNMSIFTPPLSPLLLSPSLPSPSAPDASVGNDGSTDDNHYSINMHTTPTSSTNNNISKKRKNTSKDLDSLLMTSIARDLQTTTPSVPALSVEEKDPDTLFCLSLVQEFKELPPRKKRLSRLKIMELFCAMHEDDEN